jgi:serine protease Do
MTRRKKLGIALVFMVVGVVFGLTISSNLNIQTNGYTKIQDSDNDKAAGVEKAAGDEKSTELSSRTVEALSKFSEAMVELVASVRPSVVNISTTRIIRRHGGGGGMFDDPFFRKFFGEEFFRQFERPRTEKRASLGSGVIVDPRGYILTNNHVIKDAEEIKVTLSDNSEHEGKVIGTDPKTDLAVIKIDANGLNAVKWGDSDELKVGEIVVAVGSPYGLAETVTSGIVSAKGRANVRIADYEDFIQTDAAINPGNSGGPLINIRGRLVGINTAIFSTSGGYQGIGFSIPSNMARVVMESLVKEGKVVRGWLGVTIQPVTGELAGKFGLEDEKGALVSDVVEGSPADKAGVKRGDIIVGYRGKEVGDPTALRNDVAATPPATKAELKVVRDGKEKALKVVIGELPEDFPAVTGGPENALRGVQVQDMTPEIRKSLGVSEKLKGVVVTFAPEGMGLKRGDVIVEIDKKPVEDVEGYNKVVSEIPSGADVLLLVHRNGGVFYMTMPGGK